MRCNMRALGFSELVRLVSTEHYILDNLEKEWPQLASVIKNKPIAAVHAIHQNEAIENSLRAIYCIKWNFFGKGFAELVRNINNNRTHDMLSEQPLVISDDEFKDFLDEHQFNYNYEKRFSPQQQYQLIERNDDTSQISDTVLDLIRRFVLNSVNRKYSKKEQNYSRFTFNTRDRFELHERDFYNDNNTCLYWQENGWIEFRDESVASWMRRVSFVGNSEVIIIIFQLNALNKLEQSVRSLGVAECSGQFEKQAIKDGVLCHSIEQILL